MAFTFSVYYEEAREQARKMARHNRLEATSKFIEARTIKSQLVEFLKIELG